MATKPTTPSTTTPATGLRAAKKEQAAAAKTAAKPAAAKKAPETPAFKVTMAERRAPAKSAPAAKTAPAKKVEKATGPKRTYTATGRCGAVRTTQSTVVMSHAVDVADSATSAKAKAGQIWGFFSSAEAAQKAADRAVAKGYDAKVVPAQLVTAEAVA
jgi:DNA-binding protein HU-beta